MSRHREHPADPLHPLDPGDDEIRRALADLPWQQAPAGFTAAVLRRLDEPPRRRSALGFDRWPFAGGALAATAAALVLAIVSLPRLLGPPAPSPQASGGPSVGETPAAGTAAMGTAPIETAAVQKVALEAAQEAREARTMLERLRREHRRLEQDLRTLGGFTGDGSEVIYLGGDESLDLVLDLGSNGPWASAPTRRSGGRAQPSRNPPNFL